MNEKAPLSSPGFDPFAGAAAVPVVRQVADLVAQATGLKAQVGPDGLTFSARPAASATPKRGVVAAEGRVEPPAVAVVFDLCRLPPGARVPPGPFFEALHQLGERSRVVAPAGDAAFRVELQVQATPLSVTRASVLLDQIKLVNDVAAFLQEELPQYRRLPEEVRKLWKPLAEALEPITPLDDDLAGAAGCADWAAETLDLADAGLTIAIAGHGPLLLDFAAAALARGEATRGATLGRLTVPAVTVPGLLEVAGKAPGGLVVPATRVALGASAYELQSFVPGLLAALESQPHPAFFVGTQAELQASFHGGQGGAVDPLVPVVRHVPELPFDALVSFGVRAEARAAGGLPRKDEEQIASELRAALGPRAPAARPRLVRYAARRAAKARLRAAPAARTEAFLEAVDGCTESLGGLAARPRGGRSPAVAERFTRVLSDPGLLGYLQGQLLAQDEALAELCDRLYTEATMRPAHQPLCYCAEGRPGIGKSEAARLIAERLGVRYENIDAASFSDFHTASAQLFGSGRGIVGSYQAGRLERAAKQPGGILIEVSDLDHAPPHVRAQLADLFLQVLETGEAQSATGAMFSCANVIFAFTMNLPGRTDDGERSVGFAPPPSRTEVTRRVHKEISALLSEAFASRVDEPVVFRPLNGEALGLLIERTVRASLTTAIERLGHPVTELAVAPGVGARLLDDIAGHIAALGARAAHGRVRKAAGRALRKHADAVARGGALRVSANDDGTLRIDPETTNEARP